jgi:hypothetical protein
VRKINASASPYFRGRLVNLFHESQGENLRYQLCRHQDICRPMKTTKIALILAIMLAQSVIVAQVLTGTTSKEAKRRIVPGLKVGVNRSNVYNESGEAFAAERKQGYAAGFYVALPLGGLFGFQPEMVLQQKGFEGSGVILGDRYVISRTTTHLDFPLQLQFKPFKWFTFLVGPQYSVLLKQTDSFGFDGNSVAQRQAFDSEDPRRGTLGTILGIDLNFGHLVLSGRSGWDVDDNPKSGTGLTPGYRNRWLQGTIGYRFY